MTRQKPEELPNAELELLAYLWNEGASTARKVRDAMQDRRPMAHATAITFLNRLEAKGLVTRKKVPGQRGYVYSATRRPGPTYRRILDDMTERLFGGSYVKLVNALFKDRKPTEEEIEQLREIMKEYDG